MHYRPDIDGLRAIAILLVLIYHSGLSLFPSGFVGVDVFFVISGFLITGIITDALNDKRFSFIQFYQRRLWRLQPVFICFIVCAMLTTLLFFLPEDLMQFNRSARKSSLFIANVFFNQTTTGYFSPNTQQLPLLHMWSLSIEWQCYLLLPLLLFALHRLLKPNYFNYVIYALTLLCLLLSWHNSTSNPAQTYYLLSSRLAEFLIGACIALMPKTPVTIPKQALYLTGMAALACIFYIAHLDNILIAYPNSYAFGVCLATGVLIILGMHYPAQFASRFLSCKPLVFIGLLSYSLYVWHWLVFAMLRYQGTPETAMTLAAAFGLSFLLAYLSWRFIEIPARKYKQASFRTTCFILLLLPVLLTHAASYITKHNSGFPQRFNEELVSIYAELERYDSPQRPLCISKKIHHMKTTCTIGSKEPNAKKALMIGDSFSNHYWGFIDTLAKASSISVLAQGTSSCITLPGILLYDWWYFKNQVYQECAHQTARYYRMIDNNHYDYVIIGQVWENYFSDSIINQPGDERSEQLTKIRLKTALHQALERITRSGAKPVLMKSTAIMQEDRRDCFFQHIKLRQPYHSEQCQFITKKTDNERWLDDVLRTLKAQYPQLVIIDPKKVQCEEGICKADINGIPVYRDAGHITDYASYQLGAMYLRKFGNPLNPISKNA